jgi:uncharacterized protein (DUF2225 family)
VSSNETVVPDLYRLAFMPGQFRCPLCQFQLSKQTMFMQSGSIGISEADLESELCPNDGTPMVHVTYKEQLTAYDARLKEEFNEVDRLKALMGKLLTVLKSALRETGCDGDLCCYSWHEEARAVIALAEEQR